MAIIYMQHPVHGSKIATLEAEAIFDESNGWMRYDPDTHSVSEAATPANELIIRRRGRPPLKTED